MASASAENRPNRRQPRARIAHKSKGKPVSKGIRWDRLPGSWLLIIVLVMGFLYVPPLHGYYTQRKATGEAKATLQELGKENRELRARSKSLKRQSTIELEARKLGMVKPDERPFVILEDSKK